MKQVRGQLTTVRGCFAVSASGFRDGNRDATRETGTRRVINSLRPRFRPFALLGTTDADLQASHRSPTVLGLTRSMMQLQLFSFVNRRPRPSRLL
jgi:hypothetical protein